MDDNPYTAPQTASEAQPRVRPRFGLGNLLFLGLGSIFLLISASIAISEFDRLLSDIGGIVGTTAVMLLGAVLITHGALRSDATIRVVTIVLVMIILLVIAAVILT